ncbi:uncharacterized protein LOC103575332 [Microplitis demolitor]|uniref:uncharacterized protein LOC103575332 n=1 Tax=Microplitis demolitor TaxID=69319 RepID=UPI00235B6E18|nr:uncharacterized protein LOC103575332 [Microplitis demolitor]
MSPRFKVDSTSSQQTESDLDITPPRKIAKVSNKHRQQKFRDVWLKNVDYKQWLSKVPEDRYKAKCRTCNATMNAELTVIKNHITSKTHLRKPLAAQQSITTFIKKTDEISTKAKAIQALEIKLCGFLAKHNISFTTLNHLTTLLQSSVPDSEIIKNMQMKSTKRTAIVKNVIAAAEKEHLQQKLQTNRFSVLIDESTDIGGTQTMCIIGQVVSKFRDLCQIFDQNSDVEGATAEYLFGLVLESLEDYEIPFENIIGFASDEASIMMGKDNSVASRFLEICLGIYIFKCICHSLHLCASNACKKLPKSCKDLTRNVYGEFKNSAKQQHLFKKFQIFLDIDIHKILCLAQTRWLSLKTVVSRIIEQWPALELYFRDQMLTIRLKSVEQIVQALNNPIIKLFYLFLDYILLKFTKLNELFQSSSVVVTSLHDRMCKNYQELLEAYMSRDYIYRTDLSELDPCNESHRLRPENMYFGIEVRKMLDQVEIRNNEKLK